VADGGDNDGGGGDGDDDDGGSDDDDGGNNDGCGGSDDDDGGGSDGGGDSDDGDLIFQMKVHFFRQSHIILSKKSESKAFKLAKTFPWCEINLNRNIKIKFKYIKKIFN